MFAFNLRYLSPRAYEYIRNKFDSNLPHSSTVRKWFAFSSSSSDGGFVNSALQSLRMLAEELAKENKIAKVSVSIDEVSIRQQIQYLHFKKRFSGFINFGTKHGDNDSLPVATHAIVIMVNGINVRVTLPIAFFFITQLIAEEKAILIASIVKTLTDIGVRVVSITGDGIPSNIAAYEILGASFSSDNIVPYFIDTETCHKVYTIHDPPHMLKLLRNYLGDAKIFRDSQNRTIEWKFIERLYRSTNNELTSHKLTKIHVDYKSTPMKVGLAAQTYSNSVATSIDKLRSSGLQQFQGSEGTVEFIDRVNKLFDVFNSDVVVAGNVYKSPINPNTKDTIFTFLDDMVEYFCGMTLKGKSVLKSTKNTGFKGFIANSVALKLMYQEFVESNLINELRTVSIQQDLLESFFGRIRSAGGNNTNPNVQQFCASFRQALLNKELTCSALSNCVDKLDIFTVSSGEHGQQRKPSNTQDFIMLANTVEFENESDLDDINITPRAEDDVHFHGSSEESAQTSLGVSNIAGYIEELIQKNKKFNCDDCAMLFEVNQKIDPNLFIKNKKNSLPYQSTFNVCKIANNVMSNYLQHVDECYFDYTKLFDMIKSEISLEDLYSSTNFDHNADHKTFIIDLIIEEFIRIRAVNKARLLTLGLHKNLIRSAKTHDIHFAGQ